MKLLRYATANGIGLDGKDRLCFLYPSYPNGYHTSIVSDIHSIFGSKKCTWVHYGLNMEEIISTYRKSNPVTHPVVIVSIRTQHSRDLREIISQLFQYGATIVVIIPTYRGRLPLMLPDATPIAFFKLPNTLMLSEAEIPWDNQEILTMISSNDEMTRHYNYRGIAASNKKASIVHYDESIGKENL